MQKHRAGAGAEHCPQVLSAHRGRSSLQGRWGSNCGNALELLKGRRAQLFPADLGKRLSSSAEQRCVSGYCVQVLVPPIQKAH